MPFRGAALDARGQFAVEEAVYAGDHAHREIVGAGQRLRARQGFVVCRNGTDDEK